MKTYSRNKNKFGRAAQALIEFAIVLPLLLALFIGILEFGRMVFIYSVVTNASREAVRYGSAIGFADNTYYRKYQYCAGIRTVAKKYGFLLNLQDSNIAIAYEHWLPGASSPSSTDTSRCAAGTTNDSTVVVKMSQDRVKVTVTYPYSPMVKFIPIPSRNFISTSARTIAGYVQVYP